MKVFMSLATALLLSVSALALAGGHAEVEAADPFELSGQAIFEEHCAKCHDSFFGRTFKRAPRIGKVKQWADIIPEGVDQLTQTTIEGKGRMKARGDCEECTDDQLRSAVEYIISQSQ